MAAETIASTHDCCSCSFAAESTPTLRATEGIGGVCLWSEVRKVVHGSKPGTLEVSASSRSKDADAIARESGRTAAVR